MTDLVKPLINLTPCINPYRGDILLGQTEHIRLSKGKNAWGGLVNPFKSNVNLFVNAFTITNHSNQSFEAEIWFNPIPPGKPMILKNVTPANTAFSPLPKPEVKIAYAEFVEGFPRKGVMAFRRIVPPQSTLASDEDGKFIFPPGGSFILFLVSPNNEILQAEVAFGWFEKDKRES